MAISEDEEKEGEKEVEKGGVREGEKDEEKENGGAPTAVLEEGVMKILAVADPAVVTIKTVMAQLQEDLGWDVGAHEPLIKDIVMRGLEG